MSEVYMLENVCERTPLSFRVHRALGSPLETLRALRL